MESELLKVVISQGPWAALFVALLWFRPQGLMGKA